MRTVCPCGQPVEYPDNLAGAVIDCPSCSASLELPLSAEMLANLRANAALFTEEELDAVIDELEAELQDPPPPAD